MDKTHDIKLIDKLDKKELNELIGKCWMTHDAMWFYHCYQEFGIEKANRINKAAIRSLAQIESNRFKKVLKVEKIETLAELKYFLSNSFELIVPDFMNFIFNFPEENVFHWEFNKRKCFAYNGMKNIGVIGQYECGVIYRIERWLKNLNIKYDVTPKIDKCVVPQKGSCSGDFRFYLK